MSQQEKVTPGVHPPCAECRGPASCEVEVRDGEPSVMVKWYSICPSCLGWR